MVLSYLLIFFVFSKNLLRKKASILLGIRFDDTTYQGLKKHLKSIDKAKDLVSDVFIINSLIIVFRDNNIFKLVHWTVEREFEPKFTNESKHEPKSIILWLT